MNILFRETVRNIVFKLLKFFLCKNIAYKVKESTSTEIIQQREKDY